MSGSRFVIIAPNPDFKPDAAEGNDSAFWIKRIFKSEADMDKWLSHFGMIQVEPELVPETKND